MAAIILLAILAAEIALLVVTFRKQDGKQQWLRRRMLVSAGEAIALALLMVLPLPQVAFDFRWIMLFAVLAVRAIIALIVYLVRRNKLDSQVPQTKPRSVLNVTGSMIALLVAAVPALLFPYYAGLPTTGDYQVTEAHAIMVDTSRVDPFEDDGSYRELPVYFYYPDVAAASETVADDTDAFPLVVFSHGAFGFHESNFSLCTELASHGYVVAALDYPHHAFVAPDTQGNRVIVDRDFIQSAIDAQNGALDETTVFELKQEWMDLRMADLGFAIDTMEAAKESGALANDAWYTDDGMQDNLVQEALTLANVDKIGLVGHSMGGAVSVGQGRIRSDVGAVVDLDGTMFTEELGYDGEMFTFIDEPYPAPLLSIDNEEHYIENQGYGSETGQPYVNNAVLDGAITSAHTYFVGSGHMNFTDLPLFSPALAGMLGTGDINARDCIQQTNELVLSWFDQYLKGQGAATIEESYPA